MLNLSSQDLTLAPLTMEPEPELRILLLEDRLTDAELALHELRKCGLRFTAKRVLTEADYLAQLEELAPDLILADYALPAYDGLSALKEAQARHPEIPFIFVSGTLGEETAIEALHHGATDYVLKQRLGRLGPAVSRAMREVRERTQRQRVEAALRRSEQNYREIFNATHDAIFVHDAVTGEVLDINQTMLDMYGLTREDLPDLTSRLFQAGGHYNREEGIKRIRRAYEEGPEVFEWLSVRKNGEKFWTEIALRGTSIGGEGRVLAVVRDITERRRAEQALRESSQFNDQIIASVQEGLIVYDRQLRYQLWNPFMEQLTGLKVAEVVGKTPVEVFPFLKELGMPAILEKALAGEARQVMDFPFRIPQTGKSGWVSSASSPLRNTTGDIIGVIETVRDVTERQRLEENFRHAQKMEAIGQLAGGVAHDFNNIMAAILMHLGLLQTERNLSSEMKSSLKELEVDVQRGTGLTRQLLLFSRRQVMQIKPLDLNQLLADLLKMLRRLLGEAVEIVLQASDPQTWVEADAGMMEQLVMNLSVNARDAMPQGGRITIATSRREIDAKTRELCPEARPGSFICLSVTDTGCGMDAATLQHIFEPFFTTKDVGKGTGLGLATVHGIVRQHQGWIEVQSTVGQGSAFHVFLPALRRLPHAEAQSKPDDILGGHETILLVEDEAAVRNIAARTLRRFGYRVLEASNGQEALRQWEAEQNSIDLLLSDMVMPETMTGLELAARLKSTRPGLKVIISSGYSPEAAQLSPEKHRGIAYLPKPYSAAVLAQTVRRCLDAR